MILLRTKRGARAKETTASKEERSIDRSGTRVNKSAEDYAAFREFLLRERAAFVDGARKIGALKNGV